MNQSMMLRVEHVADHAPDDDRAEADEHPLAQLVEMLDERRLLAVVQATRKPGPRWPPNHRLPKRRREWTVRFRARARTTRDRCRRRPGSVPLPHPEPVRVRPGPAAEAPNEARVDLRLPVTESLNSRMPEPSERPISGSRLAPNRSRARSEQQNDLHGADVWHGGIVAAVLSRLAQGRPAMPTALVDAPVDGVSRAEESGYDLMDTVSRAMLVARRLRRDATWHYWS